MDRVGPVGWERSFLAPTASTQMPDVFGRSTKPQATLSANVQIEIPVMVPSALMAGGSGGGIKPGMPVFRDRVHGSPESYDSEVVGWVQRRPEEHEARNLDLDFPGAQLAGFSCTTVEVEHVGEDNDKRSVNLMVTGYRTVYNNGPTALVPEEHVYVFPYDLARAIAVLSQNQDLRTRIERLGNMTGVFLGSSQVSAMLMQFRTTPNRAGWLRGQGRNPDLPTADDLLQLVRLLGEEKTDASRRGAVWFRSVFDSTTEYLMSIVPGPPGRYIGAARPLTLDRFRNLMGNDQFRSRFMDLLGPVLRFAVCPAGRDGDGAADPLPEFLRQSFGPGILHEACKRARASVQAFYAGTVRQSTIAGSMTDLEMYIVPPAAVLQGC